MRNPEDDILHVFIQFYFLYDTTAVTTIYAGFYTFCRLPLNYT